MIIQVMPQYSCNLKCDYCYLGELTEDKTCLSFERFCEMYKEIVVKGYNVEGIEVFGGDLATKEATAFVQKLCRYKPDTSVMGNMAFGSNSCSLNFERLDCKAALTYINMRKHCNVYTVVLPLTAFFGPKAYLNRLSKYDFRGYLNFIEFIPSVLSKLKAKVSNKAYSKFMINAIKEYYKKKRGYKLGIIEILEDALHGHYDPTRNSHIFISPYGKYGYTSYTEDGLEYFTWCDTLEEWEQGSIKERFLRPLKCTLCQNNPNCIAEHLRRWDNKDDCCGHSLLIDWWKKNRGKYGFNN